MDKPLKMGNLTIEDKGILSWTGTVSPETKRHFVVALFRDFAVDGDSSMNEAPHVCKSCGYPIHPSETYCGECMCEDDGL